MQLLRLAIIIVPLWCPLFDSFLAILTIISIAPKYNTHTHSDLVMLMVQHLTFAICMLYVAILYTYRRVMSAMFVLHPILVVDYY